MADWTAGYVTDVDYTFGYYPELNPRRIPLAFLGAGLAPPEPGIACELGFGQGLSANIHAAAAGTPWFGADFNPAHAAFAQELARASGASAQFVDQSFVDYCSRADLPDFDYIGMHGIWSWISDENRAAIADFINRKLKPGGVLYVSYNTQPGWAAMSPMRDLLLLHGDVMSAPGQGIAGRVSAAFAFGEKLLAAQPRYAQVNPSIAPWLADAKVKPANYLAHEFFNRNWLPMSIAGVGRSLVSAKLEYACSATYVEHVDAVNLTADQRALLKEIPDPMFRETVRDFCVNQRFRRDYWVKGARRLHPLARLAAIRAQRVLLVNRRADVKLEVTGGAGPVSLREAIYGPILDALANHRPATLAQIEEAVKDKDVSLGNVLEAAMLLIGNGTLMAVQDEASIGKSRKQTDKLNAYLCDRARGSADIGFLASPVTGGGFPVGRIQQLFLLARTEGRKLPADWTQFVWQILASQGHRVVKDGKPLESADDNVAELKNLAQTFADAQLPILKALGIA